MKLKKIAKIFSGIEHIRVWGEDENEPLFDGYVEDLPSRLIDLKLIPGPEGGYCEVRYGCSDCNDHVAVFVEEKE